MDFWVFLSLKTHRNACYAGHQSALVPREKRGSFPEKRLVIQPTRDHIVRKRKRHLEFRLLYRLPILEQITADKKNKFRSLLARREISWQAPIPRPLHVICALSREKARAYVLVSITSSSIPEIMIQTTYISFERSKIFLIATCKGTRCSAASSQLITSSRRHVDIVWTKFTLNYDLSFIYSTFVPWIRALNILFMFWAIYYNVSMTGFVREHEPVLFCVKKPSLTKLLYAVWL